MIGKVWRITGSEKSSQWHSRWCQEENPQGQCQVWCGGHREDSEGVSGSD